MRTYFSCFFLYFISLYAVIANAATPKVDALYTSCVSTISRFPFECPKGFRNATCTCSSPEFLASFMNCVISTNQSSHDQVCAQKTMIKVCKAVNVEITEKRLASIYRNATEGDFFVPMASITNTTAILFNPVKVSDQMMMNALKTFKVMFFQTYYALLNGGLVLAYWGLVLFIGTLINLTTRIAPKVALKCNNKFWTQIRQKIAMPAAYGYSHSSHVAALKIVNLTVPTRPQSLVLVVYGLLMIALYFPNYELFREHIIFPSYGFQLSRYVGVRSGIMAMCHLPLVFLFAGRNNIMLAFTGWSYETFNVYHRWTARGMYINVAIHAITFSRFQVYRHAYPGFFTQSRYITWGLVACIMGAAIMFFSFRHFRDRTHELFLILHWIFVSVFLASVYWHTHPNGFAQWIYASIAIWAFDRVARLVRIVVSGLNAKAHVQLFPHNVMKFKIDYSNAWSPSAGNYPFVTFHRLTSFWQSHPFTVYCSPAPGEEKKMVFCVRKRTGVTETLAKSLASRPQGTTNMRVLIDGPYGQRFPLASYGTVVFISGGIGATATFSHIDSLKRAGRAQSQRLIFLWVVRYRTEIEWFREELEYLTRDEEMEIRLYITNQGEHPSQALTSSDNMTAAEKESNSDSYRPAGDFNALYCKPDINDIVTSFVGEVNGSIAFFTCGPSLMNDDARASVTNNLTRGTGRVDYFEESFAW